jgi:diguanylate cyclase (GGDEF)-like protein
MARVAEQGARAAWLAPIADATASAHPAPPVPVVPGQQLLQAASALADGALEVHAQLQQLEPDHRVELLEVLTRQLNTIVGAWVGLIRDMLVQDSALSTPPPLSGGGPEAVAETPAPTATTGDVAAGERTGTAAAQPSTTWGDDTYNVNPRTRDELTGLLDRPAGFGAVRRQMERARQLREPMVVGYVDVNGLRRVNDTRGIRAGDELLRSIAASLRTVLREHDVVARVGGDKFVFAMAGVDIVRARERFVTFVVAPEETAPPSRVVRVGFAELRDDDTVEDLVARAEAAVVKPPL